MRAMILAAGRGQRMGSLTNDRPKPLISVASMPLIEYHVRALAAAGISNIVINTAYLGDQIVEYLQDGRKFKVSIEYSHETQALGTGGGIRQALPLLGARPFLVVNSDIWTDYPFASLQNISLNALAHLVLVPNPAHHRGGDFGLGQGRVTRGHDQRFTFSGIGIYKPEMFADSDGEFELGPLLKQQIDQNAVSGMLYKGRWWDVGTVQRLHTVESFLKGDY